MESRASLWLSRFFRYCGYCRNGGVFLIGYHKFAGQPHISKLGEAPSKGFAN